MIRLLGLGPKKKNIHIWIQIASFEDCCQERVRIYRFIRIQASQFWITTLCRVCRVSRSAYYAWASRGLLPSEDELLEVYLANQIYDIWKTSKGAYGEPRISVQLKRNGQVINPKRVARIMADIGICGACGRKKMTTTTRDPNAEVAKDTAEGWLYLASVLDVFSKRLLGWSSDGHYSVDGKCRRHLQ